MSRILDAVSGLNPEPEADALDQLFDVAKKFKPLSVPEAMEPQKEWSYEASGSYPIPLDQCDTDPSYQRPLDREKVAAMKLDKAWEKQPIHVNMDGGTYWIVDGQHRAEAARQAGVKEVHAFVDMMPSQAEAKHETGVMAKTLQAGDAYEGHVLPSHEPALLDVLEGMGAERQLSKVESYGWHGRCYVVPCSTGTITYVPHDAVEKDAGGILTQPERGLLRFDGLAEAEVQYVLKTIGLDVAPLHLEGTPDLTDMKPMADALGITSDAIEVLCEGIGGRTWQADWVYLGDSGLVVTDGQTTLASYPVVSRHPTGEGDWRFIGPKHDLTVRPA